MPDAPTDHQLSALAKARALASRPPQCQGRSSTHRIKYREERPGQRVYFIQSVGGQIKIGTAINPVMRLGELQVANPDQLALLGHCAGGARLEAQLHAEFTADWIRGEWFLPSDRLMAKIGELTAEGG